jgi:hypothetical protein
LSRILLGRPLRLLAAVFSALLAVAAVAVPLANPAGADTTPSTTSTATPSGGSTITYSGAGTPINLSPSQVDSQIAVHVARTGSANVFGIQGRICKGGAVINNLISFSPGQAGLCVPAPLDASSDAAVPASGLQPAGDAPTNTFADIAITPGAGTTNFAASGLGFANFTCGVGNPCQLVLRESTSDTPGDNYVSFALNYQSAPLAPAAPTASAGDSSALVSWVAPANGFSPITDYVVTPYIGGVAQAPIDTLSTSLSKNITGLTNFTAYTFSVHAVNALGAGAESPQSTPVTPTPAPPVITGAQAGNASVTLTWSAAGGSPTGYSVASIPAGGTCTTTTQLTCVVSPLANNTSYTFVVTANYTGGTAASAAGPVGGVTPLSNFGNVTQTFTLTKPAGQLVIGEACSGATGGPYPDKPYLGAPTVPPGPENCNVTLAPAVYNTGGVYTTSGAIDQVTVRDLRDTDVGWHVDASLTAWNDLPASDTFGACTTGFAPTAAGEGATLPYTQTITAGAAVTPDCSSPTGGYSIAHTVMSGAAGHGLGDSDLNGTVSVNIPVSAHSGTYSAVMTFTLFTG